MGGVTIRDSLGRLQYQFLAQLANAGRKSVEVNLKNCHREICRIKVYQIVTSEVLTSLLQFDKSYFDKLRLLFIHEYIIGAPKEARCFLKY